MSGLFSVFRRELRRIFTERSAFSVMVLATVIYAGFYPQPYVNEALRSVPLVLVDQDRTTTSRELARRIDATAEVAISASLTDLPTAEYHIYTRKAHGLLLIPPNFERDLLHGRPSPVALYADASYFLIYQQVALAVTGVARTLGAEVEVARLAALGIDLPLASAAADPMRLTTIALFNPQGGYASYVLPAAFVLILQQTLLMGVGLLGAAGSGGLAGSNANGRDEAGPTVTVAGKLLAYLALHAVLLPAYLIGLPYLYGVPRLGDVASILVFAVPFVLSVGALGLVIAKLLRSPLVMQLMMAALGLPFFFLAGFAWPFEAIPRPVQLVAYLLPSTSAIDGFVRLSQMGASLSQVSGQLLLLWCLAAVYGCAACLLEWRSARAAGSARVAPAA